MGFQLVCWKRGSMCFFSVCCFSKIFEKYWGGQLAASGDPAAACCCTIPQLMNPLVVRREKKKRKKKNLIVFFQNPNVSGENPHILQEMKNWKSIYRFHFFFCAPFFFGGTFTAGRKELATASAKQSSDFSSLLVFSFTFALLRSRKPFLCCQMSFSHLFYCANKVFSQKKKNIKQRAFNE
jgi:hypothetical protein